jgi:hypothetical protein
MASHYRRALIPLIFTVPYLVGCVGSYGDAKVAGMADRGKIGAKPTPSPYCQRVDARRDTWGAIAKFTALVSAGVAAAAAAIKDDKTQVGFAIGAAAGTGISGGEFYYSETQGKLWARDCSDQ